MEIINPVSRSKALSTGRDQVFASLRSDGKTMFFTKGAMDRFLLKDGMRLVFAVDIGRLYFYITKEKNEGFLLWGDVKKGYGLVCSILLIKTIRSRLPDVSRNGPRLGIRVSNTRINDCATFEIIVDRRYKSTRT